MKKIRETLKLLWSRGLGARPTARVCGMSHSTVLEYERRAREADLSWEEVEKMDSGTLERRLFPLKAAEPGQRPLPDWSEVHAELHRPGVTLQLLWDEYRSVHPEGYQYSRFCELYRVWRGQLDLSMRQEHKAGEKVFVDYCGQTVTVVDASGNERQAKRSASNGSISHCVTAMQRCSGIDRKASANSLYPGHVPRTYATQKSTFDPLATSRGLWSSSTMSHFPSPSMSSASTPPWRWPPHLTVVATCGSPVATVSPSRRELRPNAGSPRRPERIGRRPRASTSADWQASGTGSARACGATRSPPR